MSAAPEPEAGRPEPAPPAAPAPKLNLPGSAPRDPLAVLRLALRQGVQRQIAPVIASAVVTVRALELLAGKGGLEPYELGLTTAALTSLRVAVARVDAITDALVDSALESSAAQEAALAACQEAVREAVLGGLRAAGAMIGAAGRLGASGGPPKFVLPN